MTLRAGQRAAMISRVRIHLDPGEVVADVTFGALHVLDGRRGRTRARAVSLLVTDRRVLLFRKRWGGHDVHTLRYDQIEGVDHGRGVKVGELRLWVSGRGQVRISSIPGDDVERVARLLGDRLGADQPDDSGRDP